MNQDSRAFQFVRQLAAELGQEELELPAFPDVVGPANSAAMNPAGRSINNINGAVTRLTPTWTIA